MELTAPPDSPEHVVSAMVASYHSPLIWTSTCRLGQAAWTERYLNNIDEKPQRNRLYSYVATKKSVFRYAGIVQLGWSLQHNPNNDTAKGRLPETMILVWR